MPGSAPPVSTLGKFDPWGPISSVLFHAIGHSERIHDLISRTGVEVAWPQFNERSGYSHTTRIREILPRIEAAYAKLSDDNKGVFVQVVAKGMWETLDDERKQVLQARLNDIGWVISADGTVRTQSALLSEGFFPAGTQYDAYVAIREILVQATRQLTIVDGYLGQELFTTLRRLGPNRLTIKVLTNAAYLKADFRLEARKFREQFGNIDIEVRDAGDFHDRFILADDVVYHVGASMKDAGKRAFLLSRLEDQPVIGFVRQYTNQVWAAATPVVF